MNNFVVSMDTMINQKKLVIVLEFHLKTLKYGFQVMKKN